MQNFNDLYRPKLFSDILGNDITTSIIAKQIAIDKLPKVYIFVGPAGVGKTSLARVIARELGVENPIEINASVTNSVEDIRNINEDAQYMSLGGGKKVYILDEVHRLSKASWSASLKLLEEPPEETLFILCTTEYDKIPQTILSRAQVFYLQPVPTNKISERLGIICNDFNLSFEPEALEYLARGSMGCVREAIQKLEQVSVLGDITLEAVKKILPDLDLFEKILLDKQFDLIGELANNSVSIDSLIGEAVKLAIANKFPRKVAIGLVKLRPCLTTPFNPSVVRAFLESSFEGV